MTKAAGFTILELLVVMSILGLMSAIAVPSLSSMRDHMQVVEMSNSLALTLGEIRAEAVRLRAEVGVTFTQNGVTWDVFADGSVDGRFTFSKGCHWSGSVPSPFTFDGLGLASALNTPRTLIIKRGRSLHTLQINRNGFITV
jgi:prepilin-type N-terminal cleavage/methylation domain-containing protein